MNCANSLCNKKLDSSKIKSIFPCEFCKDRVYCSRACRDEDWHLGHDKVCELAYKQKVIRIEKTCPFIKSGIVLTEEIAKRGGGPTGSILDCYEKTSIQGKTGSILGKGSFGKVLLMRHKENKNLVAMKVIEKINIRNASMIETLRKEIEIHKKLIHENIIRLFAHEEDKNNLYIIME